MSRPVTDSVDCRGKPAVGLPLKVLTHVAYESAGLRRCTDPDAVLVEHFEGWDGVL